MVAQHGSGVPQSLDYQDKVSEMKRKTIKTEVDVMVSLSTFKGDFGIGGYSSQRC